MSSLALFDDCGLFVISPPVSHMDFPPEGKMSGRRGVMQHLENRQFKRCEQECH